jgi:hypothetical protein
METGDERFQTLLVYPARAIYLHKRLFRASQVQQLAGILLQAKILK